MFQQGDMPDSWMITLWTLTALAAAYSLTAWEEEDFKA
jgi:hypothetical protein